MGQIFTAAVDKALAGVVRNPLAYSAVHGETRRAIVQRFPYAIYFRVIEDDLVVLAVIHARRLPHRWQSRS